MSLLKKLPGTLDQVRRYLGFWVLALLMVLGFMNVIHTTTYQRPTDGAVWRMENGRLTAVEIDMNEETGFQVGDVLVVIDDVEISNLDAYEDFLWDAGIGSKHLYLVERQGTYFEPWVIIRGLKDEGRNFLPAMAGFVYVLFLLLILNRMETFHAKTHMAILSLCVYFDFVFQHTDSFTTLDWVSFYLDQLGGLLLPSALAALVLFYAFKDFKWLPFVQAVHWVPSFILTVLMLYGLPQLSAVRDVRTGEEFFQTLVTIKSLWGGTLIVLAMIISIVVTELSGNRRRFPVPAAVAWLPFALTLLNLEYPFVEIIAPLFTMILPISLVVEWSRSGDLFIGDLAKKALVYFSVGAAMVLAYLSFVTIFQALLQNRLSRDGQWIISGVGILTGAVAFTPLKNWASEWVDRLVYGERFESLKLLLDFSEINRADIKIDEFLSIIRLRLEKAFALERCRAFRATEHPLVLKSVGKLKPGDALAFRTIPRILLEGKVIEVRDIFDHLADQGESEIEASDLLGPIVVGGRLAAVLLLGVDSRESHMSPEEMRLLQSLVNQCEVLMENMELYQAVAQKAQSIMQLKEYNENIIESSRVGILATDDMGKAVMCNSALSELAGVGKGDILGRELESLLKCKEITNQSQAGAGFNIEGTFTNIKREELILEIQRTPLKTKDNQVYGTLYLVEDVAEKKATNEKMMQQEKLASIGLLAAGVAHEINTPLTGIASYAQLMLSDQVTPEQKELLDLIQGQSRRASGIVGSLLNFSRKDGAPKGPVDLLHVLDQTLGFLSHQIQRSSVRVTVKECRKRPIIEGYSNKIQQVFVNLIVNALDAMPKGGDLEIDVEFKRKQILMFFKDTGLGMDKDVLGKLFDPFFTTKEVGKGTGLGLSVVYTIMQDHGATIEAESKPGQGSTFILTFPVLPGQSDGYRSSAAAGTTVIE